MGAPILHPVCAESTEFAGPAAQPTDDDIRDWQRAAEAEYDEWLADAERCEAATAEPSAA